MVKIVNKHKNLISEASTGEILMLSGSQLFTYIFRITTNFYKKCHICIEFHNLFKVNKKCILITRCMRDTRGGREGSRWSWILPWLRKPIRPSVIT